jgi:hypothetical protein
VKTAGLAATSYQSDGKTLSSYFRITSLTKKGKGPHQTQSIRFIEIPIVELFLHTQNGSRITKS